MKPTQKAPKNPGINSSPMKRLLKWITTTVSSTGGVTYTQVKNFVAMTEKRSAPNFNVKDVLKNFLETGRLQKVGYKYVIPTSPIKKQIVRKTSEKKSTVKRSARLKDVDDPVPATKVKSSPGNLEVREAKMPKVGQLEGNAKEGTMSSGIMDAGMPTQIGESGMPAQIVDARMPTQSVDAGMPTQIVDAGIPALIVDAEMLSQKMLDAEKLSQNAEISDPNFGIAIEREIANCDSATFGTEIKE